MAMDFIKTFSKIQAKHDETFHLIDDAIRHEEHDRPVQALNLYKLGIVAIDETLALPVGVPDNIEEVNAEWNEACKIIHKLKRTRAEVVQRVGVLSQKHGNLLASGSGDIDVAGPSTDSLNGVTSEHRPRTYTELAQALREMKCTGEGVESLELLFSCEGVKLYYIKPNGLVTTALEDSILRIVRLDKDDKKLLYATYFIQIIKSSEAVRIENFEENTFSSDREENVESDEAAASVSSVSEASDWVSLNAELHKSKLDTSWIYPLIPGVSPCFRTEFGAFILPDLEATETGSSFGIIVPKESGADEIVLEILEGILHGVAIQSDEPRALPELDLSQKVSSNIVRGAYFVSQNLVRGAEKAGEFISYSTPFLISKMQQAPSNAPVVPKNVQNTVEVVKCVSGTAAGVTGFIAGKVGSATMALGRFLAPHIQNHGSMLLSKGFGIDEATAQQKMSGVLTVAAGAVEGFGAVYAGLEESAGILGKNLSGNSVKIIEHKYGSSAGSLAAETFDTVGNVINLTQHVNSMTPKGLVKRTAKNTGKAIVEEYKPKIQSNNVVPAGSLYPDLSGLQAEVKK